MLVMSWSNIVKQKDPTMVILNQNQNKYIEQKKPIIEEEETLEDLFEIYNGAELLNDLIYIKENCEKHTPWLLSEIKTIDLYDFIYTYVDLENTIVDNTLEDNVSEHSSSVDEYNEYDINN